MTGTTANTAALLRPEDVHALVVRPAMEQSIAAQAFSVTTTDAHSVRFPIVTKDPTVSWVAEGEEIGLSDLTTDDVKVVPQKLAGLSIISRELAQDSSPAAQAEVGAGLARDLARKIDAAVFGAKGTDPVRPAGLEDLVGTSPVAVPLTSLDWAAAALMVADNEHAQITSFVMNPADLLTLSTLKEQTGSLKPLLGTDPTQPGRRQVAGVPILTSDAVTKGTVWGIPRAYCQLVVRQAATLDVSYDAFFTSDRVAVKATMRVNWAFTHPAAIAKVKA